jgi:hypothetical protein
MDEQNPHDEPGQRPEPYTHDFKHTPISARVPEKIGRGAFANAVMILQANDEFILDFLSTMSQPQQVVSRVVLTATTFGQFIAALRANVAKYEEQFGPLAARVPPPAPPAPGHGDDPHGGIIAAAGHPVPAAEGHGGHPGHEGHGGHAGHESQPPPRIDDLYDQLKLPDELLGGAFANVVMLRHTPEEFAFDFIASFYPRPVVAARVYMAAGRIPSFIDALWSSHQKYQQRPRGGPPPEPPADVF